MFHNPGPTAALYVVANLKKTKPLTTKTRNVILIVLLVGLFVYGGLWFYIDYSIKQSNLAGLEKSCQANKLADFKGTVKDVERFEYDDYMSGRFLNLRIETDSGKIVNYHYNLKDNKELSDFVRTGQKTLKAKGMETFILRQPDGTEREFLIADCDKVKKRKTGYNNK
jgi:hypothetical protein